MKRKTGRRIISMVLAVQLPLSTAAQAAAPLITSTPEQDAQSQRPISFRDFLRSEEATGRYTLPQEPMWQKLRLISAAGKDTVSDDSKEGEGAQPAAPTAPASDSDGNEDPPASGGEADDTVQPSAPGDDVDTPAPDTGGDTDDQPADPVDGTGEQESPGGEEDTKPDLPAGDDSDSQLPDNGEQKDGEAGESPSVSDPADGAEVPSDPEGVTEDVDMAAASLDGDDLEPPFDGILKIAGYGDYGVGFAGPEAVGSDRPPADGAWEFSPYNLEWDGYRWKEGRLKSSPTAEEKGNYDSNGIFTTLYGYGEIEADGSYGPPWYDEDNPNYASKRLLSGFAESLPRLPNKEFDGWYIQRSKGQDPHYFDYIDPDFEIFEGNSHYAHEGGLRNGVSFTTAVSGVDDQVRFDPTIDMSFYVNEGYVIDGDYLGMLLPVIGVWKDSSNATATGLKVTTVASESGEKEISKFHVYAPDLLTKTNDELQNMETTSFASDTYNYFIRVPFGTDKLNFDFTTFEPGSTVVVENAYQGHKTDYNDTLTGKDNTQIYEDGVYKPYDEDNPRHPTNTPLDDPNAADRGYNGTGPARKIFTLGDETTPAYIDLGVYNYSDTRTCNVITFTVTAPDKTTSKVYTLYVQRLADPTMSGDPGNTPYGMIWREWPDNEAKRNEVIADFASNEGKEANTFKDVLVFESTLNNGGNVYPGRYRNMAWVPGTANLDHDKTAIVAYTNSTVQIPDATVVDGLGVSHKASEYHVSWELSLTQVDTMGPEIATDAATGTSLLMKKGDNDMVTLPANIKPGIYTLSYTYTDPYDGAEHSDEGHGFSRQLVILPLPGDVDMDGTVTSADGVKLKELLNSGVFDDIGTTTDAVKRLYYYRVCNVDNRNEKVDENDIALLTGDFETPAYGTTAESAGYYMYLPLTTETVRRRPAVKTEGKAQLSVDYLGMEKDDGTLDPALRPNYDPQDVRPFWMGVHLTGDLPEGLTGDVTTMTFTLIYDPTYVAPWAPASVDPADYMTYLLGQNSQWSGYTLLESSGSSLVPSTHLASKATPALSGRESNLRELRFSVQGSSAELSKLADGLVLKVPFQLKGYPSSLMDGGGTAALVDASLGAREFVITTETTGTNTSAWNNAENAPAAGTTNLATSLTYTGTDRIPIGENKAPGKLIQIKDKENNDVNPVYGDAFAVPIPDVDIIGPNTSDVADKLRLPPGITYDPASRMLKGTPTEAGTYSFIVQRNTDGQQFQYQITVDKAPLHLTVQPVSMYYGQDPRQNGSTTEQTFTYDTAQIKAIDKTSGKTNGGTASELSTLLNKENDDYEAPKISLRETQAADGTEVTATTVPGAYWAVMEGGSSRNYRFYYVQPAAEDVAEKISPDFGWAALTVKPRPILVDKLTKEVLGEILVTSATNQIEGNTVSYLAHEFDAASPAVGGRYDGMPLSSSTTIASGDQVVLDYTVMVENLNEIKLSQKEEIHDATVADVRLATAAETNRNNCYVLVNLNASDITGHPSADGWVRPTNQEGKVTVKAQELNKLKASWRIDTGSETADLVYTYGQTLSLSHLSIELTYLDAQGNPGEAISFGGEHWTQGATGGVAGLYRDQGIAIQWVESEGAAPAEIDPNKVGTADYTDYYPDMAYTGQQITVADHSGKWLCVSAPGTDLAPVYIGPFTVNKKPITIKVNPQRRYYGEENPGLGYRYDTSDLASWDQDGDMVDTDIDALKRQLANYHYVEPQYKYSTVNTSLTGGEAVTAGTDVGTRYMLFYGAKCDNYSFEYQFVERIGNTESVLATSAVSEDPDSPEEKAHPIFGYVTLTILKRPIMVTEIKAPAGTLLFDSATNVSENVKASTEKIVAVLPEANVDYWLRGNDSSPVRRPEDVMTMTLKGDPIRSGDNVVVQYTATFEKANENSQPYWDLGDKSSLDVKVDISQLELLTSEGKGGNYELVFAGFEPASSGWTVVRDPSQPSGAQYKRTDTKGTIVKRRMTGIQVIAPPKLAYTYGGGGEFGTGTLDLSALTVQITYEDNSTENLTYDRASGSVETNTFAQKGLEIHWGTADGAAATNKERLTVTDHNNKQLVITGRSTPDDPLLTATLAPNVRSMTVTVAKRELILKASDQTRAYGENNGDYEFTFDPDQLAQWDRELLDEQNLTPTGSATELKTASTSAALSAIDSTFQGPTFYTTAGKDSNVDDYTLYLRLGKDMENYMLFSENATIHVVERPVYVTQINKTPLNSVHVGASTTQEYTVTGYVGGSGTTAKTDFDISIWNDGSGLTFEGNNALVGDDMLGIKIDFNYTNTNVVTSAAPVRINSLTLDEENEDSKNYALVAGRSTIVNHEHNWGEVHEKRVTKIEPSTLPNLTFDYGDRQLDLLDLRIEVTYEDGTTVTDTVEHFSLADAYYYDSATVPASSDWEKIPTTYTKVQDNDHLTVNKHNGKYILVLAKVSNEAGAGYVTPIILRNNSSSNGAIQVRPRPLTYTFTAADKVYDTTTVTTGTIQLTNVYGTDKIWVDNGTDYTNQSLGDYTFASGSSGIRFTFTSPNAGEDIVVRVDGIRLLGPDSANYDIGPASVTSTTSDVNGRDGAPKADITKAPRDAMHVQATDVKISLTVDEHTNAVAVSVDRPASTFGNTADRLNGQLQYEYQLIRLNDNGTVASTTAWQQSPYFGGEQIGAEYGEMGTGPALNRGQYMMANVRLCETGNYQASDPTNSVTGNSNLPDPTAVLAAIADARQAVTDAAAAVPADDKNRTEERLLAPVTWTYTYRVDLYDSTEVKGEGGAVTYTTTLVDVWFTDITAYPEQRTFERLVGNLAESLYTGYFWDKAKKVTLTYGENFDLSQDITVKLSVEQPDGTTAEEDVVVNPADPLGGRDLTVYVTTVPRADSSPSIKTIELIPTELTARLGDEPVQLELNVTPKSASTRNLRWSSSNPAVATVDRQGIVTFVSPGTAVITVQTRSGSVSASMTVKVLGDHPYGDSMLNVYYDGAFMDLYPDGIFAPELTMSRQTMITLVARVFQTTERKYPKDAANVYGDVPGGAVYLEQLDLLDRWGIINGIGDNLFAPDDTATRAEAAVVLCQMLMLPVGTDPNAPHAFVDATPENHWAWAYIDALAAAGITVGTGGGCYSPDDPVTRAELATFIAKSLATEVDTKAPDLVRPTDVTEEHWAHKYVLRAVNSGAMVLWKEES